VPAGQATYFEMLADDAYFGYDIIDVFLWIEISMEDIITVAQTLRGAWERL